MQARDYFVKSSQETRKEGKGKNNPKLSEATKHDFLAQLSSGRSIPTITKTAKHFFDSFQEFHDSSDDRSRASPSQATLYRIKENLPLANRFHKKKFVEKAERLTLSTDGVSIY